MSYDITVEGGKSVRLPTAGKYCDRDIVITATGGGSGGGGGSSVEWIGDGNTHLWITLSEGRTSPQVALSVQGNAYVDWGDGTAPSTVKGTTTIQPKRSTAHEYAAPGDYVISVTVDGKMGWTPGNGTYGAQIIGNTSLSGEASDVYRAAVRRIEMGNGATDIRKYSFKNCYGLESVKILEGVPSIGDSAFSECRSLGTVEIPEGVTSIGASAFSNCRGLATVKIPGSVTSIGAGAFQGCVGVRHYDLTKCTAIPALADTTAFDSIPTDCEVRVPAALYDAWIAADNWAAIASNIVAV